MKKHLKTVVLVLLTVFTLSFSCSALTQDTNYMYNGKKESYTAPVAYTMGSVLTGNDIGVGALKSAQDLYVHTNGDIYIADTGNNRIIVTDSEFKNAKVITEVFDNGTATPLSAPEGIFRAANGLLYICDTGNRRIVAVDDGCSIVLSITGEDLVAVNKNLEFKPEKVAVDSDNTIYAIDSNIYQGILQYDAEGNFSGFFSPNDVKVSAAVRIANMWKNIFNDEQQDYTQKILPAPYNNIYMSRDNFIYTSAIGVEVGDEIKCLNTLGTNILVTPQTQLGEVAFGDLEVSYDNNVEVTSCFIDVHCDENGVISALDETRGRIFQYDRECNLVCVFGGKGSNKGYFSTPVAIDKIGEEYIVLDSTTNAITTFVATDYIKDVYEALDYYNKGLYEESVELWQGVLAQNNNYTIAYKSIGRAYLQQGYYEEAMEVLKEGNDKYFYSMALQEFRKEYTRGNLWWMLIVGVAVIVGVVIGIKKLRCWLQSKPAPARKKKG